MNKTEIKIFLTFFLIYLYFVHWVGANENSRLALTKAIVDEGKLTIDSFYNFTGDRSYYQGHYYSDKEPGLSFLATPIYAAWKFIYYNFFPKDFIQSHKGTDEYLRSYIGTKGVYIVEPINPGFFDLMSMILVTVFTSSIFSSLTVVLVYKFTKFWDKNECNKIFVTFIAGLATLIFPYGQVFLDHGVATFFAFFAFYLLFKMRHERRFENKYLYLAGISSGFAITVSIVTAVISMFCLIYLFIVDRKKLHFFILGGILGILPLLIYNFLIFNSPFQLTRFYLDPEIWGPFAQEKLPSELSLCFFSFYRQTFDSYKGLFFYYPILLLSFLGIYYAFKKYKIESLLFLALILIYILANKGWWTGGTSFGLRHLTPISPFLVVSLVFVFQKSSKKIMFLIFLLFLYSTFVNLVGTAPVKDVIEDKTRVGIAPEFKGKIVSFEFLANPIYDYYLPMFLSNGPRSRLFEGVSNGIMPDIRFLTPEQREFFYLFYFHIPFLSLFPIILVCVIIWWSEIFTKERKRVISENRWKILITLFIFTLFIGILFIRSLPEELSYHKGWFPPEKGENWMGSTGTLLFYNRMGERTVTLSFYARSYMKDRNIQFYSNDIPVENFTVYPEGSEFVSRINLKSGLNIFKFESLDGCDRPNILEGTEDYRCLSVAIKNISLNFLTNTSIILKKNFYLHEENISWMRQDGTISVFNLVNKTQNAIIKFYVKSFYIDRPVVLYLNGQPIDSFMVFKEGSEIYTPLVTLKEGENILTLHSLENCTIVADIEKNNDFRCLSIGLINLSLLPWEEIINNNLSYIFAKGWYQDSLEEEFKYMNNKSTLYLINKEDYPIIKIINLDLKAFMRDRETEIVFNNKNVWRFDTFKEGNRISLPLELSPGINSLEFSTNSCNLPDNPNDKRCLSIGVKNVSLSNVYIGKRLVLYSLNWYNKDPQEEEIWMKQNGIIYVYSNVTENVKFYFNFSIFALPRKVSFYLNDEMHNVFDLTEEGGEVYTSSLILQSGFNILKFYSEEPCVVIANIAKNDDYRCVSIGLRNIKIESE